MHEFKLTPQALAEVQKRVMQRIIFLLAIVLFVGLFMPALASGKMEIGASSWLMLLVMVPVLGVTVYFTMKRTKANLSTYKLIVTEYSVTREMRGTPTIVIAKSEIKEIVKQQNGAFAIIGGSRINAIGVSPFIENPSELERLLADLKPITVKTSTSWLKKYQLPVVLATIALMMTAFYATNKYIATFAGCAFAALMIYSFVITQMSKNVERRTKRMSYFFLLPLLSVILSVIGRWVG